MLGASASTFDQAFNLGPLDAKNLTVAEVLNLLSREIHSVRIVTEPADLPESGKLGLNSNLAIQTFGWSPRWNTDEVMDKTASWYMAVLARRDAGYQVCVDQLVNWSEKIK